MPSSIDATCGSDVTAALNNWIRSVPNGTATSRSTLSFAPNGCYRIEDSLVVADRQYLTFDGNGATFKATTIGHSQRSQWEVPGGTGLTWQEMTVIGVAPAVNHNVGTPYEYGPVGRYDPSYEWQHAWSFNGGVGHTLDGVAARNIYGDFVSMDPDRRFEAGDYRKAVPVRGVTIRNSDFRINGRQAISCTHCSDIVIEDNYLSGPGQSMFDIEVEADAWYAKNIFIRRNRTGKIWHVFVANEGAGDSVQDNINVTDNVMEAQPGICYPSWHSWATTPGKRTNLRLERNVLRTYTSAFAGNYVSGVTVKDNTVYGHGGGCGSYERVGVRAHNSSNGLVTGNHFRPSECTYWGCGDTFDTALYVENSSGWTACGNQLSGDGRWDDPVPC